MLPNWSAGAASADNVAVDPQTRATFQRLADAVFTDRTDALVDRKQNPGKAPLTSGFSGDVQAVRVAREQGGLRALLAPQPQVPPRHPR